MSNLAVLESPDIMLKDLKFKGGCLALMGLGILLDQWSKSAVLKLFYLGEVKPIFPGFNLTLSYNPGIAFGWFNEGQAAIQWGLLVVICSITLGLILWMWRTPASMRIQTVALSLIISGAVGNLYDRFSRGYVVDFLDFYVKSWHFHTFNLADTWITLGAGLLILSSFVYCHHS